MGGKLHIFSIVALLVAVGACANRPPSYPYAKEPNPLQSEYVIGVADNITVNVWQHEEFNTALGVRPDGEITLPLIGDVRAAGLTPTELKAEVGRRLKTFIKDKPLVTVAVTAVNSYYVTVSGRVGNPGRFSSPGYLNVADAIALAGGPDRFASPADIFVLRTDKRGTRRIPVNYDQIKRGEFLQQNIYLLRGDHIFVP